MRLILCYIRCVELNRTINSTDKCVSLTPCYSLHSPSESRQEGSVSGKLPHTRFGCLRSSVFTPHTSQDQQWFSKTKVARCALRWLLTLASIANKARTQHNRDRRFLYADAFSKTVSKCFFQGAFKNKSCYFKKKIKENLRWNTAVFISLDTSPRKPFV